MKNFNTPADIVLASIIISMTILYSSTKDPITNCMKLVMDNSSVSSVRTAASRCSGAR
jgi:hypothetical protein